MANQQEQWCIPTYNGIIYTKYLISSLGRLVSKAVKNPNKAIKKPLFDNYIEVNCMSSNNYKSFNLYNNSDRTIIYVHRLMWESFVCPITPGMVIDHINNVKDDNRLVNLQMITSSENAFKYHNEDKKKK